VNYRDQQRYFTRSRIWGGIAVTLPIALAAWAGCSSLEQSSTRALVGFAFIIAASSASLYYTPDYLHLTVNPDKRAEWAVKIRWRIAGAVLIVGTALSLTLEGRASAAAAAVWLLLVNVFARHFVARRFFPAYFWTTDLILLVGLFMLFQQEALVAVPLTAAALHFAVVICRKPDWIPTLLLYSSSAAVPIPIAHVLRAADGERTPWFPLASIMLVSAIATALLVRRARCHNDRNVTTAVRELREFTGYFAEQITDRWAKADKQLAQNWEASGVGTKSAEEIAGWYRQNSELYMFAISAYNLEYKRIKSNLKMLRYATGACLDYGAGNGELILECARRGHRAAYYDVDGISKRFAQFRAAQYGLAVDFAATKDELRRIAEAAPFDTVFSFDVLEHIPDLAGELDFLISLLRPNGLMMFDVPAGSTVSHPMHLNHTLKIREHMLARGMADVPMRSWRIGKQEKYAFRKVAGIAEQSPANAIQ